MSTTSDFHFEQPAQPRRKKKKTSAEIRTESIERKFASKTDRQLLEEQVHLDQIRNENIKSIKDNVQFFFWITMIGIILWVVIAVAAQSGAFDNNY